MGPRAGVAPWGDDGPRVEVHPWTTVGELVVAVARCEDASGQPCGPLVLTLPDALGAHEERLLAMLDAVCGGAPDARVGSIELLSPAQRRAVLDLSIPRRRIVDELSWTAAFERCAARDPDATAVVCEADTLTYAELEHRSAALARTLVARGVVREDVVAVAVPRSPEMVVALIGVMRAGAAYLPLDLDHPPDRIAYMLGDCGARVVVTTAELAADLPAVEGLDSLLLDDPAFHSPSPAAHEDVALPRPAALEQAAYVIYHVRLDRPAEGRRRLARGHRQPDRHRDGPDRRRRAQPRRAVRLGRLRRRRVGPLHDARRRRRQRHRSGGPAGRGRAAGGLPRRASREPHDPAAVARRGAAGRCELPQGALLVVGTETVQTELVNRWSRRLRVVAAYGLTEATVNSTLWPAEPNWRGPVPIGVPDPNTRAYVLDGALRPVAVGVAGSSTSAAAASPAATSAARA